MEDKYEIESATALAEALLVAESVEREAEMKRNPPPDRGEPVVPGAGRATATTGANLSSQPLMNPRDHEEVGLDGQSEGRTRSPFVADFTAMAFAFSEGIGSNPLLGSSFTRGEDSTIPGDVDELNGIQRGIGTLRRRSSVSGRTLRQGSRPSRGSVSSTTTTGTRRSSVTTSVKEMNEGQSRSSVSHEVPTIYVEKRPDTLSTQDVMPDGDNCQRQQGESSLPPVSRGAGGKGGLILQYISAESRRPSYSGDDLQSISNPKALPYLPPIARGTQDHSVPLKSSPSLQLHSSCRILTSPTSSSSQSRKVPVALAGAQR